MAQVARAESVLITENLKTTSRNVARDFRKEHSKVVRSIKQLIGMAPEWGAANFGETPYVDSQNGQTYEMYEMTRDGFALLVMGFTGQRAFEWKLKYLEAFNAMEVQLRIGAPDRDRFIGTLDKLTPAQMRNAAEFASELEVPDGMAKLQAWLETTMLDGNMPGNIWDTYRHVLNVAKGLQGKPTPLMHTRNTYVEADQKGGKK